MRENCEKEVEKMKDHCGIVEKDGYLKEKVLEDDVKKLRENYENELEKERGFVVEEKKKVEKLTKSQMEFEVKMNEHCGVLVKEWYLKKKMLEDEVKNLEKELEKMKERCGVVEKEGYLKQKVLEDEVKRLKESYEK
ncbi:hypothetical protein LIER_02074 [Lithospermum erythrorhizon]|uniref:Uncharacterized protein n=1 Tax=Lithospermum erythrorhizon TaxID=34254 RepID=A0AAV3NP92_LITER